MQMTEHLDLVLYGPTIVSSFSIVFLVLIGVLVGVLIWFFWRKRVPVVDRAQRFSQVLTQACAQVASRQLTPAQGLGVATTVLKAYSAWRWQGTVGAMTDRQWLDFVESEPLFEGLVDHCRDLVRVSEQVKFNYVVPPHADIMNLLTGAVTVLQTVEAHFRLKGQKPDSKT